MSQSEKKLILLVDDDQDFVYQRKIELEASGYRVIEAYSASQAEKLLEQNRPNLVIADLMMEQEDSGFLLCYHIRKNHPGIPIIMVTGVTSETGIDFDASTDEERTWIKADVLLDKPIRTEQLLREVESLLRQ